MLEELFKSLNERTGRQLRLELTRMHTSRIDLVANHPEVVDFLIKAYGMPENMVKLLNEGPNDHVIQLTKVTSCFAFFLYKVGIYDVTGAPLNAKENISKLNSLFEQYGTLFLANALLLGMGIKERP